MEEPPVDKYHVIHFTANFDGTPISYWGPTFGTDLGVSDELFAELEAWSLTFEGLRDDDSPSGWMPGFDADGYEAEGDALAQRIADNLGSTWAISRRRWVGLPRGWADAYWIRSSGQAIDVATLARAERRAQKHRDDDERWAAAVARGAKFELRNRST